MTDEPETLALRSLRRLDEKLDRMDGRLGELTHRVNDVYGAVTAIRRDQTQDAEIVAHVRVRIDQMSDRIDRIERRLDLAPAE